MILFLISSETKDEVILDKDGEVKDNKDNSVYENELNEHKDNISNKSSDNNQEENGSNQTTTTTQLNPVNQTNGDIGSEESPGITDNNTSNAAAAPAALCNGHAASLGAGDDAPAAKEGGAPAANGMMGAGESMVETTRLVNSVSVESCEGEVEDMQTEQTETVTEETANSEGRYCHVWLNKNMIY